MNNLGEIFRLPKWAKISLVALSGVAIALLVAVFSLQQWADNQVESAQISFSKIDKAKSADLESGYAYEARVHFQRLDFLLRSRTISHIDLEKVAWESSVDSSAIQSIETHNRRLSFTTTQNLALDSGANLGIMSYKIDFAPFSKAIMKYYVALMVIFVLTLCCYNVFKNEINSLCNRFIKMLKTESLPNVLWQSYKNINPLYRHTFWIVFIACNLVFGFHTIHFIFGNHDWWRLANGVGILEVIYEGRYTQHLISAIIQGNMILPVLNNLLAFGGIALASVWLCMYLNIQRKLWIWVIIGFVLTLQPFTLTRMYFAFQVAGLFIAVAIGILGFVLAKKAGEYRVTAQIGGGGNALYSKYNLKPYTLCFLSILCIHWGIASYQPFIDTALILLCGGIIAIIIDNNGDLRTSLYKSRFIIISVLLAAISHKITLDILKKIGKTKEYYNIQLISLDSLPEHIIIAIKLAFKNLVNYDVAFMPLSMTILFAIFLVAFLVFLFKSKLQISTKINIFILLCGAILASQTHIVLSKELSIRPATEYYGLMFLRVLFVALVLKIYVDSTYTHKLTQNLLFILSTILIWVCVVQDLYAQRVQKFAFDYEFQMFSRVIDRIEQNENFSHKKSYNLIVFGEQPSMRENYYKNGNADKYNSSYALLKGNLTEFGYVEIGFFSSAIVIDRYWLDYKKYINNKTFQTLISRLHKAGILDKLQPFPHKDSVVVFEDIIVFVASKGDLDEIKQMAKELP